MTTTDVISLAAAYQPGHDRRNGLFIVLEGISGAGKSTLAALLARQLGGRWFHTVPARSATWSLTSTPAPGRFRSWPSTWSGHCTQARPTIRHRVAACTRLRCGGHRDDSRDSRGIG